MRNPSRTGRLQMCLSRVDVLVIGLLAVLAAGSESPAQAAVRPLSKVALAGEVAPGTTGATFVLFDESLVNTAGDVTFGACYSGGGGAFGIGCGIFLSRGGTPSAIVVSGQSIPGIGTVTLTSSSDTDGPIFNNNGTVGLVIQNGSNGNTGAVLQRTLIGALTILAKNGGAAPGTSGTFVDFDDMSQNNNDDMAFIATYNEAGTLKTGLWIKPTTGALTKVIAHGDPVPAGSVTCPSGFVSNGTTGNIDGPWMNDSRVVVFLIDGPCGNDPGAGADHLLVKQPTLPLAAFVTEGDPAPASIGGTIGGFKLGRPALNNSNTLAYRAVEITGGTVGQAIVTHPLGGSPVSCVAIGASAPSTAGTISNFVDNPPTINQNGRLSFVAGVTGDVTVSQGIFTCQSGTVAAIALQGDPIPGTTSSVFSSSMQEASISDDGRVTFLHESAPLGVFVSAAAVNPPTAAKSFMPNTISVGGTSVLTITLSNSNAVATTGAGFTDTYPSNLVNTASPGGATTCLGGVVVAAAGGGSVALSGGTIPASGSCTVTVNVTSAIVNSYNNTIPAGGVTSTNAGSSTAAANATLTVTTLTPPSVAKSFNPTAIPIGGSSVLTITLSNSNSVAITGAAFTDTYPANLVNAASPGGATTCGGGVVTAAPGGGLVALSGGTIPASGSCTVTVNVTSTITGSYNNTIPAGGVTTANAGSNTAPATSPAPLSVGVVAAVPTLSLWGVIVLASLLAAGGLWFSRR